MEVFSGLWGRWPPVQGSCMSGHVMKIGLPSLILKGNADVKPIRADHDSAFSLLSPMPCPFAASCVSLCSFSYCLSTPPHSHTFSLSLQALKALQDMSLSSPCSPPPFSMRHSKAIPVQAFEVNTYNLTRARLCASLVVICVWGWSSVSCKILISH